VCPYRYDFLQSVTGTVVAILVHSVYDDAAGRTVCIVTVTINVCLVSNIPDRLSGPPNLPSS